MKFRIDVETRGHEVYYIEADSREDAEIKWEEENVGEPALSEVLDAWWTSIDPLEGDE